MIKIKGEFENGAQMRQELLALLGLDGTQPVLAYTAVTETAPTEEATPAETVESKKKRRSKAEIEAEAAKEPVTNEPVANEPVANEPVANEPATTEPTAEAPKYTLDDAKLAAAKLSRAGHRDEAKAIAYKYAAMTDPNVDKDASLVPKIAPQHFAAFIAEIEAVNA